MDLEGFKRTNRLAREISPYLLQHASNPVDWYPWGAEAFQRALEEDRPIFLSIGYSTCHWCHVMERESFDREDVASILNEHYVAIKVDREERPDVDNIYMLATQLATGHGGWPNSLWLTPKGEPWYAGTYFPPEDVQGKAGFKTMLLELARLWNMERSEVEGRGRQLTQAVQRVGSTRRMKGNGDLTKEWIDALTCDLRDSFDFRNGGFGSAPKFPPHGALRFLLHELRSKHDDELLRMVKTTLDAMARGGIRDHLAGGFHRYATDAAWLVPHFEKMLYDNAQMAIVYVQAFLLTGEKRYEMAAREIYEWVLRDMTGKDGAFFSAMDADSEGKEGRFYRWTPEEVTEVLGQEQGALFLDVYACPVLHEHGSREEVAQKRGRHPVEVEEDLWEACRRLLRARDQRTHPHVDDKILVSWNGLMIESLAGAGRLLQESRYVEAADRASRFIWDRMMTQGRLSRSFRDGFAKGEAYAEDYAFFVRGFLALHEASGNALYLEHAVDLMETFLKYHHDEEDGGFFFVPHDHDNPFLRYKDVYDSAIPSANAVAVQDLILLALYVDRDRYLSLAGNVLKAFSSAMARSPRGVETLILALAQYLDG